MTKMTTGDGLYEIIRVDVESLPAIFPVVVDQLYTKLREKLADLIAANPGRKIDITLTIAPTMQRSAWSEKTQ